MPGLHDALGVLEYDLDKGAVVRRHNGRVEVDWLARGAVGDAANPEYAGDVEVIGDLQRRVGRDEGDAVHRIALLAVHQPGRAGELDGPGRVDQPVVVRTLRIRPRPARCQVSPVGKPMRKM